MRQLLPLVEEELRRLDRERRAAADRQVVQELRRALRGLQRRLPQYVSRPCREGAEARAPVGEAPCRVPRRPM